MEKPRHSHTLAWILIIALVVLGAYSAIAAASDLPSLPDIASSMSPSPLPDTVETPTPTAAPASTPDPTPPPDTSTPAPEQTQADTPVMSIETIKPAA